MLYSFLTLILFLGHDAQAADSKAAITWPFDQRQILLTSQEGQAFPDQLVTAQFLDAFVKRGRVRWTTRKGNSTEFLPVDVPRDFPWFSPLSVRQLGLRYKVDGIVVLVMRGVLLEMRWYSTSDGSPVFVEKVSLPGAVDQQELEARKNRLVSWVNDIWERIPGQGYTVSREFSSAKIEGAKLQGLKKGDRIEFVRLTKMTRHPLLKTVVSIEASRTGLGTISTVDDPLSTVSIDYESEVDPIQEGDRYRVLNKSERIIIPTPTVTPSAAVPGKPVEDKAATDPSAAPTDPVGRVFVPLKQSTDELPEVESAYPKKKSDTHFKEKPPYGIADITGRVMFGKLTHTETFSGSTISISNWRPQFEGDARFYISTDFLILSKFGFGMGSFATNSSDYGVSSIGGNHNYFSFAAAYRLPLDISQESLVPAEFVLKLGYIRYSLNMDAVASPQAPSGKTVSGPELGFALQIPVVDVYSAWLEASRTLGASLTEESLTSGALSSPSHWQFIAAGKYKMNGITEVSAGMDIRSSSITFSGSGSRGSPSTAASIGSTMFFAGYMQRF